MPQTFYEFETPLKLIVAFSHESINTIQEKSLLESAKGEYQQVAIIGVGCRFPGDINTPEEYWNALMAGHNFINGVPEGRADISGIKGGFLSKKMTQMFDGAMFGISPLEAKAMDPQQRILLETAWNALEHANVTPSSINGTNTAVFASIRSQGFDRKMADVYGTEMPRYMATGVDQALPANRISHFFKLKGVSYNLTSACNSGALLLDCASKAFADLTCDRAIIGGSSISSHQTYFDILRSAGIMSTDNGRCAVFDSSADGYVPTESCIVFVVRPLEAAIRDGENILGVVEGIVNHHNGGDSMGIAAPSKTRQIEVLKGTLDYVGWKPDEVDLYEAHVTGTKLGDQLEASVITTVFKSETRTVPLSIGALKGALGHTENLSALAAILKVIMAMNLGTLPPNL
ncbi:thiolase-like protein, partial [Chytriomyces cf. hyalinus JEL632]